MPGILPRTDLPVPMLLFYRGQSSDIASCCRLPSQRDGEDLGEGG